MRTVGESKTATSLKNPIPEWMTTSHATKVEPSASANLRLLVSGLSDGSQHGDTPHLLSRNSNRSDDEGSQQVTTASIVSLTATSGSENRVPYQQGGKGYNSQVLELPVTPAGSD